MYYLILPIKNILSTFRIQVIKNSELDRIKDPALTLSHG